MNITREEKKIEAIKRLAAMDIIEDAIKQFKNEDTVMVSENPFGFLYWLNDEQKEMVKKFEEEYDALVYLCNTCNTEFGRLFSIIYVSDYKEEWEMDNADIADGYVMTYTFNLDWPDGSEFGSIAFKSINGGIKRIG